MPVAVATIEDLRQRANELLKATESEVTDVHVADIRGLIQEITTLDPKVRDKNQKMTENAVVLRDRMNRRLMQTGKL